MMIKAEVVFEDDAVIVNDKQVTISVDVTEGLACSLVDDREFKYLEQAIAYCLEQSHDPKTTD